MARLLNDASSQRLIHSGAPITGAPATFACWFYPDDISIEQAFISLSKQTGTAPHIMELRAGWAAVNNKLVSVIFGGGSPQHAITTNLISANTWQSAVAIFSTTSDRRVILNGDWANSGTNTSPVGPSGIDYTVIGAEVYDSVFYIPMSGRIACAAIWNAALTQQEVEGFHAGTPPSQIRPDALQAYWKLQDADGDVDWWRQYNLTAVNSPTYASHPPIIYPSGLRNFTISAAVASFTSTAALVAGNAEFAASATFAAGTKTATAPLVVGNAELAASASFAPGTKTATADLVAGNVELVASAEFTPGTKTATASLITGGASLSASGSHTTPVYNATAALSAGNAELAASGEVVNPTYTAEALVVVGGAELTASATFAVQTYSATADLLTGNVEFAASASHTTPTYTATAELIAGNAEFAANAAHTTPTYTTTASLVVGGAEFAASGFMESVFTAVMNAIAGAAQFSATDIAVPSNLQWFVQRAGHYVAGAVETAEFKAQAVKHASFVAGIVEHGESQ